ncbi:MAG: ABC transporter ATP-binding protein/permease [Lachnospiraceae bacterium]|nr:ABC transporter ATP-binding protein/permease [Lachnospiraceae bacterium]
MRERLAFYWGRIKAGRLKDFIAQTKWIYSYARRYWLPMVFYTALGLTGTVVSLLSSLVSRDLVDIITGHETGLVVQTFCMMIGLNIGNTIVSMISNYASEWISMKVDAEIKSEIFEKILVTDWESLTNYHTGDLLTRWSSDASQISSGVLSFIPNAIIYVFRFFSAFAMVTYYDWTFAVFAFMGMPVSLLLSRRLMRRMVNNNKRSAAMGAKMSGFNQEAFSNIQTIKAFGLIAMYVQHLKDLQKEYIDMKLDFQRMSVWTSLLLTTVGLVVSYASYGWGIYRVWSGAISYGTMTMFLSLSGTLTGALSNLTSLVPSAITLTTSAGRLMDIVEMSREDYSNAPEVQDFMDRNRTEGISLYAEHIYYAYQNGTQVFEDATFYARPHEIVALVGPSGEGKTTMLRLVLALMPVKDGNLTLYGGGAAVAGRSVSEKSAGVEPVGNDTAGNKSAGEETAENEPASEDTAEIESVSADAHVLRDCIEKEGRETLDCIPMSPAARMIFSYVPQGNTMFSGTIAGNMRNVKEDATDEEIVEALKMACAWDFVEKLPDGIYSEIKERGGGFSEGQAQRLSIARALLRKSPILLLDEATSALDVATERKLLRNIMSDEYPRTCIVTTHRPTVLTICDRVYAIRNRKCEMLDAEEVERMIKDF